MHSLLPVKALVSSHCQISRGLRFRILNVNGKLTMKVVTVENNSYMSEICSIQYRTLVSTPREVCFSASTADKSIDFS